MTDIGKGTPVIFVGPEDEFDPSGLTLNALYFVEEVVDVSHDTECYVCGKSIFLSLRGVTYATHLYELFCVCAFRPLGGDAEKVLNSVKEMEPA